MKGLKNIGFGFLLLFAGCNNGNNNQTSASLNNHQSKNNSTNTDTCSIEDDSMVSAFFVHGDSEVIAYLLSHYSGKTIKLPAKNEYDSSETDTNMILKIGQDSFSFLKISGNGKIFLTSAFLFYFGGF